MSAQAPTPSFKDEVQNHEKNRGFGGFSGGLWATRRWVDPHGFNVALVSEGCGVLHPSVKSCTRDTKNCQMCIISVVFWGLGFRGLQSGMGWWEHAFHLAPFFKKHSGAVFLLCPPPPQKEHPRLPPQRTPKSPSPTAQLTSHPPGAVLALQCQVFPPKLPLNLSVRVPNTCFFLEANPSLPPPTHWVFEIHIPGGVMNGEKRTSSWR